MKLAKHHESKKGMLAPVSRALSPFWPQRRMLSGLDQLLADPFGGLLFPDELITEDWLPAVSLHEDKDNLVVKAELPGMKREEFEVYLSGGNLIIAGERKAESEEKTATTYRSERYFGRFHRSLPLPFPVNADKLAAHYKDGILTVICPKTEEAKRKQVTVKVD